MEQDPSPTEFSIPETTCAEWQETVDLVAELAGIPAGLVMRVVGDNIEVFVASQGEQNPYTPGDREHLENSGLYCETVLRTRMPLTVPNALADPEWAGNPDVALNMISYLGFPILLPDGTPFGTLCILDSKENAYSETVKKLLQKFRDHLESHLALLYMNHELGTRCQDLTDFIKEMHTLHGLIPICAQCKKIKSHDGYWKSVEEYFLKHPDVEFTHGYCPDCFDEACESFSGIEVEGSA